MAVFFAKWWAVSVRHWEKDFSADEAILQRSLPAGVLRLLRAAMTTPFCLNLSMIKKLKTLL